MNGLKAPVITCPNCKNATELKGNKCWVCKYNHGQGLDFLDQLIYTFEQRAKKSI